MTPAERAHRRLLELADTLEPSLRRAFLRVAQTLTIDEMASVVRLLERGDVDAVVRLVFERPQVTEALGRLRAEWTGGVIRLAAKVASDMRQQVALRVLVEPVVSQPIIDAVRRFDNGAFRAIQQDLQAGMREAVANRLAAGMGPRQVAVALKSGMASGLTAFDEGILANQRRELESGEFKKALRRKLRHGRYDRRLEKLAGTDGKLRPEQINKMMEASRQKLIKLRAETFARTAAIDAANEATHASWLAGVEQGLYPADEIRRFWIVADDERLCAVCGAIPKLNPEGVGLNVLFLMADGGRILHPTAHPNCRCTVFLRHQPAGVRPAPAPVPLLLTA